MDIRTSADAARAIKIARLNRTLSQQAVAEAVGTSRQAIARIERGQGATSFETYLKIFSFLDIRLSTQAPSVLAPDEPEGERASSLAFRNITSGLQAFSKAAEATLAQTVGPPLGGEEETASRAEARRQRLMRAMEESVPPEGANWVSEDPK